MANATTGCADLVCGGSSNMPSLERTRFFPRQLITADDLTQDQEYVRGKLRRHNRLLHGWGIVCGAEVKVVPDVKWQVAIQPGYVLGPYGDEIVLECEVVVDLSRETVDGNASLCGEVPDPWCSDVRVDRPTDRPLYLAVRYIEYPTKPIHAPTGGCGCGDGTCEYSRIRDGFAVKVLSTLPGSYTDHEQHAAPSPAVTAPNVLVGLPPGLAPGSCPPCPADPWVILADFTVTAEGTVDLTNFAAHRRHVVTFARLHQ